MKSVVRDRSQTLRDNGLRFSDLFFAEKDSFWVLLYLRLQKDQKQNLKVIDSSHEVSFEKLRHRSKKSLSHRKESFIEAKGKSSKVKPSLASQSIKDNSLWYFSQPWKTTRKSPT